MLYSNIQIIENGKNLGWAEGNNVGIKEALAKDADYIILSNNDIYISNKNLIKEMVKVAELNTIPTCGIYGTSVNYYSEKNTNHNQGWNFSMVYGKKTKLKNQFRNNLYDLNNFKFVDFVSGCFMMVNRTVFQKIGLIDSDYFLYCEDQDFSYRAWENGIASIVIKDLIIYHKIAKSVIENSPQHLYYLTRNKYYF